MKVQYLEKIVEDSGKSKTFLSRRIGISRTNFYNKMSGAVAFKANEFVSLMMELGISDINVIKDILDGED